MQGKSLLSDIAIIRPLLILSIILGHAFTVFAGSSSWPLPEGAKQIRVYSYLNPILISFALQAFVFVSGYLFAYKNPAKFSSAKYVYLLAKARRLLLPSVIFSILYIAVLSPQKFCNISVVYDIINGVGHLWFLPMLFWCYVFGVYTYEYFLNLSYVKIILLVIGVMLSHLVASLLGDPFRFFSGVQYFAYFVVGSLVYKYRSSLLDIIEVRYTVYSWIIIAILCIFKVYLQNVAIYNDLISKILINVFLYADRILLGVIGSITLWATINLLIKYLRLNVRGNIWFGLYIYHQIIMMLLYYHTSLPLMINSVWLPWLVFVITLSLSYMMVELTLKTKIGRELIG